MVPLNLRLTECGQQDLESYAFQKTRFYHRNGLRWSDQPVSLIRVLSTENFGQIRFELSNGDASTELKPRERKAGQSMAEIESITTYSVRQKGGLLLQGVLVEHDGGTRNMAGIPLGERQTHWI